MLSRLLPLLPWIKKPLNRPVQRPAAFQVKPSPATTPRNLSSPPGQVQRPAPATAVAGNASKPAPRRLVGVSNLVRAIQVPQSLVGLAHYEDMILYISQDHKDSAATFAFEGSLRRQSLLKEKRPVSLREIKTLVDEAKRNAMPTLRDKTESLAFARDLITRALAMRASDIHVEIYSDSHCVIKYRIDSYLRPIMELLPAAGQAMIMALYNAAEGKNKPEWMAQEICFANIKAKEIISKDLSGIRFASTRTSTGAFIALRLLPKNINSSGKFEDLGLSAPQIKQLKKMLLSSSGMVVFTGPTGAGKSTLLKYALEWLHEEYPLINTICVEDPCEYEILAAKQIDLLIQDNEDPSIDERAMAWARVIATTLRLDPDRLMISEIRDGGAAIAGFRAAQTGHLTLSTCHTNDGWEAFNRLVDLLREGGMANPSALLANSKNFVGSTAQRLVPKLCSKCKIPLAGNENRIGGKKGDLYCSLVDAIEDFPRKAPGIYLRGDGCNQCVPEFADRPDAQRLAPGAGIYGRTMVIEIIQPPQRHLDIAQQHGTPLARRQWLEDGGRLMIDHAIDKIVAGIITPEVVEEFVGEIVSSRQILDAYHRDRMAHQARTEPPRVIAGATVAALKDRS